MSNNPFEAREVTAQPMVNFQVWRLKKVGVLSVGIFSAAMGAAVGLIAGVMFLFVSLLESVAGTGGEAAAIGMGVAMLIFVPLMYGVLGFIGGVINAVIYNVLAGLTGGIEMHFGRD